MQHFSQVRLTSPRLRLVPISRKYEREIFKEFTDEITWYMFPKTPQTIEDTRTFLREVTTERRLGKDLTFAILKKSTGEFLGGCGTHALHTRRPQLGIWIKKSAHGHHYGREAVTAAKQWMAQHFDYEYITYDVVAENHASRKIAESLGGVVKRTFKRKTLSGRVWKYVEYRIYPER